MSFGIGLVCVGLVAIIISYVPARWSRYIRGAGQGKWGVLWGILLIVVGVVVTATD